MEAVRPEEEEEDLDVLLGLQAQRRGRPRAEPPPEPEQLPGMVGDPLRELGFMEARGLSAGDAESGARRAMADLSAAEVAAVTDRSASASARAGAAPHPTVRNRRPKDPRDSKTERRRDGEERFDDLLGMPELNPEKELLDLDMRLQRIQQIEETLRTEALHDYLADFDAEGQATKLTISRVPAEEMDALRNAVESEQADYCNQTVELQHKRAQHLIESREEARKRVYAEHVKLSTATRQAEVELVAKERQLLRRLATRFRSNEERLRVFLEGRHAEVHLADGNIRRRGRRYTMHDRAYSVEWSRAPQPVALHLKSLRAVRDKLPRGKYLIHVMLFDRLGGNSLCWSKLEPERWNDVTARVEHGGDHRDVEMDLDQSLRLVLPSHVMLAPSMSFVFELHQLQEKQFEDGPREIPTVVGWGAFPLCDSKIRLVEGKFKVPLLVGAMDPSIDKYGKIHSIIQEDLNKWLCNLYFAVEPLERLSEKERQHNYEVQLQYTAELLGMSLLEKEEQDDFFMLMKTSDESFDQKYDKIMSNTVRRKSRRTRSVQDMCNTIIHSLLQSIPHANVTYIVCGAGKMMGSQQVSEHVLAPLKPTRSGYFKLVEAEKRKRALKRAVTMSSFVSAVSTYEADAAVLEPDAAFSDHMCSVAAIGYDGEPELRRGIEGRLLVVWRELMWEIWSSSYHLWRSIDLWQRIATTSIAIVIAFHVHYVAQYVWLAVFLVEPTASMSFIPPVSVTYETQQMTPLAEMGTVAAGVVANLVDFISLILGAVFFRVFFDTVPKLYSDFVDAWCIYTVISPFLICAYDLLRGNWDGDMFKLYNIYSTQDGDGAVGMGLTFFIYLALVLFGYVLSFIYFIYLHQNGRVCDVVLRLEAMEGELVCPHDAEVSHEELEFLCNSAKAWRKGGARRHVTITEHSSMVDVDTERTQKANPKKKATLVRKKRATITRVWIEQVGSDGTRTPYGSTPLAHSLASAYHFRWHMCATSGQLSALSLSLSLSLCPRVQVSML